MGKAEMFLRTEGHIASIFRTAILGAALAATVAVGSGQAQPAGPSASPAPLLGAGHPVDWWFVFKFNTASFPSCHAAEARQCVFGGTVRDYRQGYGQQFAYASSENRTLVQGADCLGDNTDDPVGATFDEIYSGSLHYVVWNDQFYGAPAIKGCGNGSCGAPWGHSKGVLAWDDTGNGVVMQVSTPSWPAAGSAAHPREGDGNTLGCVEDNDILVSQHFFSVRLTKPDLVIVLKALANASVVTDVGNPQLVDNGGPPDVQALVSTLGTRSASTTIVDQVLSTGIRVVSKPSRLNVPPWQSLSAVLGGVPLRAATWWMGKTKIPSTRSGDPVECWDPALATPGGVEIATAGRWDDRTIRLKGGAQASGNHAKIGVSTAAGSHYAIFGDLNQQGALLGDCKSAQNWRGGLFYVVDDETLSSSVAALIRGGTAPYTIGQGQD
jgi:hypothetical protein